MNILDYAMQMELDGKSFYERAARNSQSPELRKILLTLADEERKHFLFFRKLKQGNLDGAREQMVDGTGSSTITVARNVFLTLTEQGKDKKFGSDVRQVWDEALVIEERAEKMYRDEAAKEKDVARRDLLMMVADEEKNHVYLIDNMLSYLKDPGGYTESSNFKNFMSLEGR